MFVKIRFPENNIASRFFLDFGAFEMTVDVKQWSIIF